MVDNTPPRKRHRRLPTLSSSFARYLSNSRMPPVGSKPEHDSKPNNSKLPVSPSSSSSSDEEEEELSEEMTVQADFGFFDPRPADFGGVKMLVNKYLDDYVWDVSGFVDLILEQTTVGSVIKLDDDDEGDKNGGEDNNKEEEIFGVISVLNLGRYAGHQCIGELKKYVLKSCTNKSAKEKLNSIFEEQASDVGLLISQRFLNCPHQLVPPFYDALFDEVSWATEDEPTQKLRNSFHFKHYVLITKIYENKSVIKQKVRGMHDREEPVIYVKAEDEIFRELSSLSFTFNLHAEHLTPHELQGYQAVGLVMVVKAVDIPKFRTKLKSLLSES